jgi:O-antigen/teichoic acid export membrane protein
VYRLLFTALFLDFWKHLNPKTYWTGLNVVPLLLLANVCLGIYYNLIAALKISNNMDKITYITIIGAVITLLINITYIPLYGMMACAWATLICYFTMMLMAYSWAQKHYPIPYPMRTIGSYIFLMLLLYGVQVITVHYIHTTLIHFLSGIILMICFLLFFIKEERASLQKFPIIGKFFS